MASWAAARRVRAAAADHRLPVSRSRAARARDDAHLARQRGRQRRRPRQRVDGVPRRRVARLRDRRHAVPRVPGIQRGEKSKTKATLVSTTTLARQAERLGLGDHLLLGRARKTGGRRKQALLADGYEALLAAIYLDGGIEPARAFIQREFAPLIADVRRDGVRGRTTSRRCRSSCRRASWRCPIPPGSTLGPIIASSFRWRSPCAGKRWPRRRAEQEGSGAGGGGARGAREAEVGERRGGPVCALMSASLALG